MTSTDECLNTATDYVEITWKEDTTAPVLTCPPDATVPWGDPTDPAHTGTATADDNCDGSVPVSYTDGAPTPSTSADCYQFTRTWTATDDCGNVATCTQMIYVKSSTICGMKWYDVDVDGVKDPLEVPVKGITIQLYDSAGKLIASKVTGTDGGYCFNHLKLGTYTVKEVLPSGATWIGIPPTSLSVTLDTYCVVSDGHNFGNICLGEGNGRTLGFWSNKNGQALITLEMLTGLNDLPLENAADIDRDFVSKTDFRNWLLRGTASSNMGYKLSTQLAAMYLNVNAPTGKGRPNAVDPNAYIYAPGTKSANTFGFATIQQIMNEAIDALNEYPVKPTRAYEETLSSALDRANNNLNFVQSKPCT